MGAADKDHPLSKVGLTKLFPQAKSINLAKHQIDESTKRDYRLRVRALKFTGDART